ncbi:hydantoinase/oxoprolinase family protein, partial [Acinetobacter baumannii]
ISLDQARQQPVRTILSGPAAGIVGATAVARLSGHENIITFDMGGTSTDVALIEGGRARQSTGTLVHGHPLLVPMLDIHTVGAG